MTRRLLPLALALCACKIHAVPELPPDRDPTQASARVPVYTPPADLLSREIFFEEKRTAAPKSGGHEGHQMSDTPAPPAQAPAGPTGHEGHGGMKMPMPEQPKGTE